MRLYKFKTLCIIPARGGSKSIPKKNIRNFKGFPLIKHSIDYALGSNLIDKVIVSTDDVEIADIAKKFGAEIPFLRPAEFATDLCQDYVVLKHALDFFESLGDFYEYIVLLRPTSPLRELGLIEKALIAMDMYPEATSIRAVAKVNEHPYRMWIKHNDYIKGFQETNKLKEPYNIPRQLLPEIYFQTGDIEVIRASTIHKGSVSGAKVLPLFIKGIFYDIDEEIDFINADSIIVKNANKS